ncbi:MAG: trypsin-like peptidase domain-containing protein [Rothia sp. (in: high G+C Gram-positive bacteria)]|nr:trypsin-like peptidase domain-containing protein [Rothia sp. (in: high G+C Gram-positive bacteria)]
MTQNPWEKKPDATAPGTQPAPQPAFQAVDDATVPMNKEEVQATVAPAPSAGSGTFDQYQQQNADGSYSAYDTPYGQAEQAPAAESQKKHGTKTLVSAALIAALVGGGVGGGVVAASTAGTPASISTSSSGTTIVNNTESVNQTTAAAAKATPSVVTISAVSSGASGSGSGVILDTEGHILTNTHVVTLDGASASARIEVQLADGTVRSAKVVGTDPTSDLAVIKIDDTSGLDLTPASLGDSDNLNVGDTTMAIGAPLGLQNTVTTGIVSNLVRTIDVASSAADDSQSSELNQQSDQFGSSPFQFEIPGQQSQRSSSATISLNVIQTDAAVNPGNSGGALVNAQGEVIGINVAIASTDSSSQSSSGNIGVGFAIPINYAKRIAQEIIDTGSATHGLLGASVTTSPANNDDSQAFGDGALIREVSSGGAADAAGLRSGDVVVAIDGRAISEANQLTAAVRQAAADSKVTLTVERNGSRQETEVTLGKAE